MFQKSRHAAEPSDASGCQDAPARARLFGRSWIQTFKFSGSSLHQSTVLPITEALPETSSPQNQSTPSYPPEPLRYPAGPQTEPDRPPNQDSKKGIFRLLPGQHKHSERKRALKTHRDDAGGDAKCLSQSHFNLDEISYFLKTGSIPDVHLKVNVDRGKEIYFKRQTAGCGRSAAGDVSKKLVQGHPVPQAEPMIPRDMYVSVRRYYRRETWYGKCHSMCETTARRCGVELRTSVRSSRLQQPRRGLEDLRDLQPLAAGSEGVSSSFPALETTSETEGAKESLEESSEPYDASAHHEDSSDLSDVLGNHGSLSSEIFTSTVSPTGTNVELLVVGSARTGSVVDCTARTGSPSDVAQDEWPLETKTSFQETVAVVDCNPLQTSTPSANRHPPGYSNVPDWDHGRNLGNPRLEESFGVNLTEEPPPPPIASVPEPVSVETIVKIETSEADALHCARRADQWKSLFTHSSARFSDSTCTSFASRPRGKTAEEYFYTGDDFLLSDLTTQESDALLTAPRERDKVHKKRCKRALVEASAGLRGRYSRRPPPIRDCVGLVHHRKCGKASYVVACFTFAGLLFTVIAVTTTVMSKISAAPA